MAVKQRQMGADEGSFQGSASVKNVTVKQPQKSTNVINLEGKMAVKVGQSETKGDSFGANRGSFEKGKPRLTTKTLMILYIKKGKGDKKCKKWQ